MKSFLDMKSLLALAMIALASSSVSGQGLPPGFNITQFLNTEQIDPNSIVTSNCVPIGAPCAGSPQQCCLSPVFVCQPSNMSAVNTCSVVPNHRVHVPIIRQLLSSFGVTTPNPVY